MDPETHRDEAAVRAALAAAPPEPRDRGTLAVLVARPAPGERTVLEAGALDAEVGLVGDTWAGRGSSRTADGTSHPDMQLTLMSTRVLAAVADPARWPLAGDQLLVDLDLSPANLPVGTRLEVGSAVVVVTDQPHTGCALFAARFGVDALRVIGTPEGRAQRLRGINARVEVPGTLAPGDAVVVHRPPG